MRSRVGDSSRSWPGLIAASPPGTLAARRSSGRPLSPLRPAASGPRSRSCGESFIRINQPTTGYAAARLYRIGVPQPVLDDLRKRLTRARWPDAVDGAGWDYGTDLDFLRDLADYWRDGYDWRAEEATLNEFEQYRAEIDGVGIHFVHERGKGPDPPPIVLTHGWPDSFYRYAKVVPLLADPARFGGDPADAFDVVVPSVPGYGFSDRPRERGMTPVRVAALWARLMADLGYTRYGAAGGDVGSMVTQFLALAHPESVAGIHLTDLGFYFLNAGAPDLSGEERAYVASIQQWWMQEDAYAMLHSTKAADPRVRPHRLTRRPCGLARGEVPVVERL